MNRQARIVSIEDDPEMRALLQLIFERQGYRVVSAKDGNIGLEMIKGLRPDVLLLDLMLPDIDGWDLYRQLKSDDDLSQLPVVVVSARDPEQDALEGFQVIKTDSFIRKPFEVQELVNVVKSMLNDAVVN